MLAAYTFESALEFNDFCARHNLQADDTYAVLQSMVPCTFDGDYSLDLRLTLVLDMAAQDLEHIKERESAFEQAQRERLREEQRQQEARDAEVRQRWMEENAVDIPF